MVPRDSLDTFWRKTKSLSIAGIRTTDRQARQPTNRQEKKLGLKGRDNFTLLTKSEEGGNVPPKRWYGYARQHGVRDQNLHCCQNLKSYLIIVCLTTITVTVIATDY